ncbi:MAG: PilN domain-containing protein, partial [Dehalococcoidales bacterium]
QDYVSDIKAITRSTPEGVIFSSIEITAGQIRLYGKTNQAALVVRFARSLESIGGFSLANINWIDRSNSSAGIALAFLITITR